jgi:hypothetical protein
MKPSSAAKSASGVNPVHREESVARENALSLRIYVITIPAVVCCRSLPV